MNLRVCFEYKASPSYIYLRMPDVLIVKHHRVPAGCRDKTSVSRPQLDAKATGRRLVVPGEVAEAATSSILS